MKACAMGLAIGVATMAASADVITDWNNVLLDTIRARGTNPPRAAREMAMVHVAMYDAVNAVEGGFEPFNDVGAAPAGTPAAQSAAVAAFRVLIELYPDRRKHFEAALTTSLGPMQAAPALQAFAFGAHCGEVVLASRVNDGWDEQVTYEPEDLPGWWVPTPPGYLPALLPQWPFVTPFCMERGDQYRQAGPPDLTSAAYAANLNEVKELGSRTSKTRTKEQTEIALFWADGPGTATPPGHWMVIAQDVSEQHGLSLAENARLFALLGMALCDAAICSWDNKYAFEGWRPITAIHRADEDGNPATEADPTWEPLITTPPFPTYTSGHSTFSGAASMILELYFGSDAIPFSTTSDGLPGVVRSFKRFSEAAEEAGRSRIYGGIHFEYDSIDGKVSGRNLARGVFENFLRPLTGLKTGDAPALEAPGRGLVRQGR